MSSASPQLDRFRALPRAIQWLLVATVAIVLFLAWDTYLNPLGLTVRKNADEIEQRVRDIRNAPPVDSTLREVIVGVGDVTDPKPQGTGADALQDLVNDILKKHTVEKQKYETRTRGRLPPNTLTGIIGADRRLDRQAGDLTFIAGAEEATAIIAELESSPVVVSITNLRITKEQSATRKVKVVISLESWVISTELPARGVRT